MNIQFALHIERLATDSAYQHLHLGFVIPAMVRTNLPGFEFAITEWALEGFLLMLFHMLCVPVNVIDDCIANLTLKLALLMRMLFIDVCSKQLQTFHHLGAYWAFILKRVCILDS